MYMDFHIIITNVYHLACIGLFIWIVIFTIVTFLTNRLRLKFTSVISLATQVIAIIVILIRQPQRFIFNKFQSIFRPLDSLSSCFQGVSIHFWSLNIFHFNLETLPYSFTMGMEYRYSCLLNSKKCF